MKNSQSLVVYTMFVFGNKSSDGSKNPNPGLSKKCKRFHLQIQHKKPIKLHRITTTISNQLD